MPYRPIVVLFAFFCCGSAASAQSQDFSPAREDSILLAGLYTHYLQQYKDELSRLPPTNRKDFQAVYADRWKNIKEKFDQQEIYTAAVAQNYLDALSAELIKANPMLRGYPFRCYFSRSWVPNAEYIGEGIILFNMGLFRRLNNESEAAFILSHEIAHYVLRHQDNSIANYVAMINSEEIQGRLRKIKGSEYRKREQLETLVKGLTFDSRHHSRDHEAQADSMGVELMRHTNFDLRGAITTLALLDSVDHNDFDTEASLRAAFNAAEYPFQQKWLHRETGLLGGHARLQEQELSDSLKTHPSCRLRIGLLSPLVQAGTRPDSRRYVVDSATFVSLQERFRYEPIAFAFDTDEYTESLFLSLQLLASRHFDGYLVAHIGQLLNGLYEAQKAHRLGKVSDLPSPEYAPNYNVLLQFVQNLYLEDLAGISYYFLLPWHPKLDGSHFFKTAYEESARIVRE